MRLNCVAQNQNKGYHCTECAEMFSTTDEPKGHKEINHSVRGTKRAVHETVIVEFFNQKIIILEWTLH